MYLLEGVLDNTFVSIADSFFRGFEERVCGEDKEG